MSVLARPQSGLTPSSPALLADYPREIVTTL
jgi:hypothetical protein